MGGVLSTFVGIVVAIIVVIIIAVILLTISNPFAAPTPQIPGGIPPETQGRTGDSCLTNINCEDGLVCEGGICKSDTNGPCNFDIDCVTSQRCVFGQCKTPVDFEEPCSINNECLPGGICETTCKKGEGLVCDPSDCASPFRCTFFTQNKCRRVVGSECDVSADCYSIDCNSGVCNGGIGESCAVYPCNGALTCDVDNICKSPFPLPCLTDLDCLGGLVCDPNQFCNFTCLTNLDCPFGTVCNTGTNLCEPI